jgi:hypothetical protein
LLDLSGAFTKGTGSSFLFDFIGGTPGTTYTLVEFGSTTFSAGDFGIASGTNGTFAIVGNTLQFNALETVVAAVPEPATLMIWSLVGLMAVGYCWRKSR